MNDRHSTVCDLTGATFSHTGYDDEGYSSALLESKGSEGPVIVHG